VCKKVEKSDSEREAKRGREGVGEGVRDERVMFICRLFWWEGSRARVRAGEGS